MFLKRIPNCFILIILLLFFFGYCYFSDYVSKEIVAETEVCTRYSKDNGSKLFEHKPFVYEEIQMDFPQDCIAKQEEYPFKPYLSGTYKIFHPNGRLALIGVFNSATQSSAEKAYDEEGNLRFENMYENGKQVYSCIVEK